MNIHVYTGDLPANLDFGDCVAIDTETMGLKIERDRLCLVQLSAGDGICHMVHFPKGSSYKAPNLTALLGNSNVIKLFHFARFDIAFIYKYLSVLCAPVYCTKIASKLVRTFTDKHGLKELCRDVLSIELNKQQQQSDWGTDKLSKAQQLYAAQDVLYLHKLREELDKRLAREKRSELAEACFQFLPTRSLLDLGGWHDPDIFFH